MADRGHACGGERPDQAFARYYSAPENLDVRKAIQLTKGFPRLMETVPTSTEVGATDVEDDSAEAYDKLVEMAEEQRRRAPTLTVAQAFARVFADPANAKLAAAAHRRPAPTTNYEFPQ